MSAYVTELWADISSHDWFGWGMGIIATVVGGAILWILQRSGRSAANEKMKPDGYSTIPNFDRFAQQQQAERLAELLTAIEKFKNVIPWCNKAPKDQNVVWPVANALRDKAGPLRAGEYAELAERSVKFCDDYKGMEFLEWEQFDARAKLAIQDIEDLERDVRAALGTLNRRLSSID